MTRDVMRHRISSYIVAITEEERGKEKRKDIKETPKTERKDISVGYLSVESGPVFKCVRS